MKKMINVAKLGTAAFALVAGIALAPAVRADDQVSVQLSYERPARGRPQQIKTLAHQVDDAARQLAWSARSTRRPITWRERRSLRRLDMLAADARHFHVQVESFRGNPRHTEDDFEALLQSYDRAADAFGDLHNAGYVDRDFRRLARVMDDLIDAYGGGPGRFQGYRGYHDGRDPGREGGYDDRRR